MRKRAIVSGSAAAAALFLCIGTMDSWASEERNCDLRAGYFQTDSYRQFAGMFQIVLDPPHFGDFSTSDTIASVLCDTYKMLNDEVWAFFFVQKANGASYQDFCRQVQALTNDTDIATAVRFSLEGTKGLYILLPPRCGAQE